jgi:hypothetical protein
MDRHNGLAGSCRPRHPCRTRKGAFDQCALRRVEEDAPFLPRKGQSLFEFLLIGDRANPAQRIRMRKRIGSGWSGRRQPAGRGIFEQRFRGLRRQMPGQREEAVLIGCTDIGQPVGGHADRKQRVIIQRGKQARSDCFLALYELRKDEIERRGRGDILHPRAHLHDLNRAGSGVRLDPSPLRPGIGVIMVADIGDEEAFAGPVHDQPDIAIDARRPEIRVLALVDAMQLKTVAGRVHLQIEDARLHRLLIDTGQAVERCRESVGDQEIHALTPRTPSSPRRRSD